MAANRRRVAACNVTVMLSEALQRNAKPRKRGDFRHPKDDLCAAKHEARLSNISIVALDAADMKRSEIPRLRSEWQKVIWSDGFQVVNVKSTPAQVIAP